MEICILSYRKHHTCCTPCFLHIIVTSQGFGPTTALTPLTKNTQFAGFRGHLSHTTHHRPQTAPSYLNTASLFISIVPGSQLFARACFLPWAIFLQGDFRVIMMRSLTQESCTLSFRSVYQVQNGHTYLIPQGRPRTPKCKHLLTLHPTTVSDPQGLLILESRASPGFFSLLQSFLRTFPI